MQVAPAIALRREFTTRTQPEAYRFLQQQEVEERKRRERNDDMDKDVADLVDLALVVISEAQAREFRFEIDRYDTATVNALYENEKALEQIQTQLDEMLAQAYVLPDGRRVFKTEDGLRVFDEHGKEVSNEFIDPNEIADHLPRWERFQLGLERRDALIDERADLTGYQDKLDDARERLDAGEMTQDEYDQLRKDLVDDMPAAVRRQIPELAGEENEAALQAAANLDLGITDDMVATTAAPHVPRR